MSKLIEDIVIQSLREASSRVRRVLVANLSLCAIILCTVYANMWAHEIAMFEHAPYFKELYQSKIKNIEIKYGHSNHNDYESDDKIEISITQARIKRIENSFKEFKLNTIKMPIIGFEAYPSSMIVICSILMLFLSVWLIFTVAQIKDIFTDTVSKSVIESCRGAERHIFATIYSTRHQFLAFLSDIVVYFPCISMMIVMWSLLDQIKSVRKMDDLVYFSQSVDVVFMLYLIVATLLFISGLVVSVEWRNLTLKLLRKG